MTPSDIMLILLAEAEATGHEINVEIDTGREWVRLLLTSDYSDEEREWDTKTLSRLDDLPGFFRAEVAYMVAELRQWERGGEDGGGEL